MYENVFCQFKFYKTMITKGKLQSKLGTLISKLAKYISEHNNLSLMSFAIICIP
jgi:hypothetical protein